MRSISLDQATRKTGYSIFEDGRLVKYGVIKASDSNINDRIIYMCEEIKSICESNNVGAASIEGIEFRSNMMTYAQLANLQGALYYMFSQIGIPVKAIHPSTWRKCVGINPKDKSAAQKKNSIDTVYNMFNISATDDEAEAILQGVAFQKLAIYSED